MSLKKLIPGYRRLRLSNVLSETNFLIGHNVNFDINVLGSEYLRLDQENPFIDLKTIDTMKTTVDFCQLSFGQNAICVLACHRPPIYPYSILHQKNCVGNSPRLMLRACRKSNDWDGIMPDVRG